MMLWQEILIDTQKPHAIMEWEGGERSSGRMNNLTMMRLGNDDLI